MTRCRRCRLAVARFPAGVGAGNQPRRVVHHNQQCGSVWRLCFSSVHATSSAQHLCSPPIEAHANLIVHRCSQEDPCARSQRAALAPSRYGQAAEMAPTHKHFDGNYRRGHPETAPIGGGFSKLVEPRGTGSCRPHYHSRRSCVTSFVLLFRPMRGTNGKVLTRKDFQ